MPPKKPKKRRTRAETDALRANIARLAASGVSQVEIARRLGVAQPTVSQVLKMQREGVSRKRPARPKPPAPEPEPPAIDVASMPSDQFYAHAVNDLEVTINRATRKGHFSAVAALRARQFGAFEQLTAARSAAAPMDDLTPEDLAAIIRDGLASLPPELREQGLAPGGVVGPIDSARGTG